MRNRDHADAWPAVQAIKQPIDIEGFSFHPRLESRRRQQLVQLHRQREALLRREEALEIDDADPGDRWCLDLRDQRLEIEVAAGTPAFGEQRGDQDVLAAL